VRDTCLPTAAGATGRRTEWSNVRFPQTWDAGHSSSQRRPQSRIYLARQSPHARSRIVAILVKPTCTLPGLPRHSQPHGRPRLASVRDVFSSRRCGGLSCSSSTSSMLPKGCLLAQRCRRFGKERPVCTPSGYVSEVCCRAGPAQVPRSTLPRRRGVKLWRRTAVDSSGAACNAAGPAMFAGGQQAAT
jgi:hypothetical protein